MSVMSTIASGNGWCLQENMIEETMYLRVEASHGDYMVNCVYCDLMIPQAAIDAIRAARPRQIPHLRLHRQQINSERSRKGWQTRKREREAQIGADVAAMMAAAKGAA
jgi:hypothetical protein